MKGELNRELLYRGKGEDNGEWFFGNHLYDDISGKFYIVFLLKS